MTGSHTEKEIIHDESDMPKCKNCGHDLTDHYQWKSTGHGCVGDNKKCICISFTI